MQTAVSEETINLVKISFGSALSTGDLMEQFYKNFLHSDPAIAPMFVKTDMDKQKNLLRQSINLAIMFAAGHEIGHKAIDQIGFTHSKKNLNISPKLYPNWKASFIKTVSNADRKFSSEVERAWSEVLQMAIDRIVSVYED
ncbi:MAG: hypothetical protein R3C03_04655 [Pirellulaceae bacterium]